MRCRQSHSKCRLLLNMMFLIIIFSLENWYSLSLVVAFEFRNMPINIFSQFFRTKRLNIFLLLISFTNTLICQPRQIILELIRFNYLNLILIFVFVTFISLRLCVFNLKGSLSRNHKHILHNVIMFNYRIIIVLMLNVIPIYLGKNNCIQIILFLHLNTIEDLLVLHLVLLLSSILFILNTIMV